jgi:hypothetical protein
MNKYIIVLIVLLVLLLLFIIDFYKTENNILSKKYNPIFINFIESLDQSSNKLFTIPHLELGDSIALNGAIRYYSSKYDTVIMVCKKSYYKQISFMYSDLKNIIYYSLPDKNIYRNMNRYIPYNNDIKELFIKYNITYIPMGCFSLDYSVSINYFPTRMYDDLNLNPKIAYSHFNIIRDHEQENILYNKLISIIGNKYIILIDDEKRNYIINDIYLKDLEYPIFKLSTNSTNRNKKLNNIRNPIIFNYIKILENAQEIISIDSSIPWLIDMLNIQTKTTIHTYLRPDIVKYNNKNISTVDGTYIKKSSSILNINNLYACFFKML